MEIKLKNTPFFFKKGMFNLLTRAFIFLCFSSTFGFNPNVDLITAEDKIALQSQISGTVLDNNGQPLPGVNIVEKGTSNGMQTDFDGNFTLTISNSDAVLVVSYLGYKTKEVSVSSQTELSIVLEEDVAALDEVVVVGFGTQNSSKVVSSVVQVTNEELNLEKRPVTNGYSALVGSAPGLVMTNNNGSPGAIPSVQIRGTSTIGDASDVLVIIDNFEGSLSDINPQDIESVSVLKDASAVAIYGARGANGVLLVTTKKASRNKETTVSYNAVSSIQTTPRLQQTVNSIEYMEFQNDIAPGTWSEESLALANSGFYPDTNWIEETFESSAVQQSHSLTLSGGSEKTGFLMTGSYLTQEGLALGEDKFERLNLRLKIDTDINSWLNIGTNTLLSNRTDKSVTVVSGGNTRGLPFYPVKTVDDLWVSNGTADGANPVASASSGSFSESDLDRINVQLYAKLTPIKGLTFEERVSYIKSNEYAREWTNPFSSVSIDPTDPDSYTNPDSENRDYFIASTDERVLEVASLKSHEFRSLTSLTYEFEKGKHYAKAFLAVQTESGESETLSASRTGFLFDNIISLNQGEIVNDSNDYDGLGNTEVRNGNEKTLSYIGRLNYSFADKYLIEAAFRRDGSSYFTDENKWGFFPSVAIGWVASRENFFENVDFVDLLKLRASYGSAGSDGTLGSVTQQLVTYDASGYPLGGVSNARLGVDDFVNQDLIWETSTILNIGLDASFFNRKLSFEAEYFVNNRKDILDNISSTAYEYGFGDAQGNPYDVRSWGWDLNVNHKNKIGKIGYTIGANISNYDNKVTYIQDGAETNTLQEGLSVNNRFGYQVDGFFDTQEEIDTYTTADGTLIDQSDVSTSLDNSVGTYLGGFKYIDQLTIDSDGDGVMDTADGVIDSDDRVTIDDNNDRNWNVGFNLGVTYENLSLSARFYGSFDNNQYWNAANVVDPFLGGGVPWSYQLDYWSETNTNPLVPRPISTSNESYNSAIDYYIVDAEFVKLQNITLNYDFSQKLLQNISFIKSLNIYLSMENVGVVWTNSPVYEHGWDPELGINTIDYPLPFTTAIGLNVKF
ncbi:SusC/RagA family TonB-linked outer membrane protein [Cellulophaga baltica]|uniref:SusC/RagA family TonB-linked outer membrane protein n=1 Tax=Cellulophaga TaxID=104264 RepID=UPI001C06C783|nr:MULTISPECIES: SusC/RagA family TonB-linked outer membrane protein [Cellulophaga]MBU2998009.1 SusC/RagA family TonB-linked outer membrane protein [Cellulophaga baltica]MDO6769410.1 SusC/RagA family TonB-linked outer membrane protein [Cellulophaga sp. 1_MG-2023]